jgi:transmembrane sensor
MSDLLERLSGLRERAQPAWNAERERRVRARVERGLLTRRRRRGAGIVLLAAALGMLVLALGQRLGETESAPQVARSEKVVPKPTLYFADGSEVFAATPETRVETLSSAPDAVTLRLASGSARFSVTPDARRSFSVVAGEVTVRVLGTIFTVTRTGAEVAVAVERGRVLVTAPGTERELSAGESATFSAEPPPPPAPAAQPSAAPVIPPVRPASPWRGLAQDGDYAAAFAELEREGTRAVRDVPEDLLLAADAARLGGRPDKAVPYLERVVRRHAGDARAALAAFTLGRTLLDQLGRPREAAQAFASARRLDASGAIREDALAREVESWSRAGDTALARERADEFLRRYPNGRRAAAVRRLGGLE